jgi:hypothetical protein
MLLPLFLLLVTPAFSQDNKDYIPQPGKFPPPNSGRYISGELVTIDPVNRRGGMRIDDSVESDRNQEAPFLQFAMLPYGMLWYNGAPAELRDIPVGTHLHGYFFLPPDGEEQTIPPPQHGAKYVPRQNHAILLEDDFSFYQRRGQAWKIVSLDTVKGKIQVISTGQPNSTTSPKDGLTGTKTFDIDPSARVWKDRRISDLSDIAPGQIVQLNLTYAPGWHEGEYSLNDIWLDEESRKAATEVQRRRHIRYQHNHWMAGWVDQVQNEDYGGGIVVITLFGGMDPSLYEELKATKDKGFGVAATEKTLRTWYNRGDKKIGQVLEWKEIEHPPLGSSGRPMKMP